MMRHPPPEYAPVLHKLIHEYRLRSLVIFASWGDPIDFTSHITPWIIQASTIPCIFRLFGRPMICDALRNALAEVEDIEAVEVSVDMDPPLAVYSPLYLRSVVVRRVSTTA